MNIVIVGGGQVGTTLAEKLSREGHDVALVERDARLAAELSDRLDVQVVEGHGATVESLRRARAADADLVLATTDSDEVNFITGRVAASLFHVPQVVVRLRAPEHEETFRELSKSDDTTVFYVNPEAAAVDKIATLLDVPGALDVTRFMDDELVVAGFPIDADSEFADRPVMDMRLFFAETPSLVVAIQRGDRAMVPSGDEVIRAGDLAYFALARSALAGVLHLLDARSDPGGRVMVAGATRIGLTLARQLAERDARVTLVEADAARARAAAEALPGTLVVAGSPTSQALLEEEDIDRVSTFVSVTADHETNLVAGLLAKRLGARRAFALVDNPALANLIGETSIDAMISPRLLAIGLCLQLVPGPQVRSMAALLGDRVEVLEAEVGQDAPVCAAPLAELPLPRGALIAALRRGTSLRVPGGADRIEAGDRVLVVAATEHTAKVGELLAPRGGLPRRTGRRQGRSP